MIALFVDTSDLEKTELGDAARKILGRNLKQRGFEGGPKMGLEFAKGIGHFEGRFNGGKAALDEGVGDAFVPPASGDGLAEAEKAVVSAVSVGLRMQTGGDAGGDGVESVEAGDFLNEINFAMEVVTKGGRLPDGFVLIG